MIRDDHPVGRAERTDDQHLPPETEGDSLGNTSRSLSAPSLPVLVRAGARALRRFPLLATALYSVQLAMSVAVGWVMAILLARAFALRPLFDRAMKGDLAALIDCLGGPEGGDLMASLFWLAVPTVLLYAVVSWFTTAGLIAVFLDPPRGRREVARWFGAAGASNFFAFVRLWLWTLIPYAIVVTAALVGLAMAGGDMDRSVDLGDALVRLGVGLSPAILLYWVLATAIDYARIDVVRHPGMSSLRALVRGLRLAVKRRLALLHTLVYGVFFIAVSALYLGLTGGGLLTGIAGVLLLRQITSVLRFAAHIVLIGGQVELGCTAMPAPLGRRRVR